MKDTDNIILDLDGTVYVDNQIINRSDIEIRKGINQKYFKIWEKKKNSFFSKNKIKKIILKYENEVNNFGYSLIDY